MASKRGAGTPTVVLVGRPNVGKSTLFNRITGSRRAIVTPMPGTTRDVIVQPAEWLGSNFTLVDTGGLFGASADPLHELVVQHGRRAIASADAIVFVVDGREGLVSGDQEIAQTLRPVGVPIIVAVNKIDDKRAREDDFYQLGFEPVVGVAAEHGQGVGDLLDEVLARLPGARATREPEKRASDSETRARRTTAGIGAGRAERSAADATREPEKRASDSETRARRTTAGTGAGPGERSAADARARDAGAEAAAKEAAVDPAGTRGASRAGEGLGAAAAAAATGRDGGGTAGPRRAATRGAREDQQAAGVPGSAAAVSVDERDEVGAGAFGKQPGEISVAIVGRPNVGKSSLVNRLLREERVMVSDMPGTTRDPIDTLLRWHGRDLRIVDTAGIRRAGKVARSAQVEAVSVILARRAIERADVAVLLIDAVEGPTDQDAAIAGEAERAGCGVIIAVNKWDLMKGGGERAGGADIAQTFDDNLRRRLKFLDYAPVLHISAVTGERTPKLLEAIERVAQSRQRRVSTGELNRFIKTATEAHPPVSPGKREVRVLYAAQTGVAPPTFVLFTNVATTFHFSYERFLTNRLRDTFGFVGTPIRLHVRRRAPKR